MKEVAGEFVADSVPQQAAALAFYTLFSLAPLLVIAIASAGLVFGREAAENAIVREFRGVLGEPAAEMIQSIVARASVQRGSAWAMSLGILMLVLGALGVFGQLKASLNAIWNVKARPGRALLNYARNYLLSFAMVMCVAFLLLVSLGVSAAIAAASERFGQSVPLGARAAGVASLAASLLVVAGLFAAMYKILPDVELAWRDVLLGAIVTSVLFNAGKFAIGQYLGRAGIAGVFGAAGSLVMVILWVYYSAIIMLLGAEFTQVYARRRGAWVAPSPHAERVTPSGKAP